MLLGGLQINVFSIIMLLIIYFMNFSNSENRSNKLFNRVIFSTVNILIIDIIMLIVDGRFRIANIIASTLYYIFTPLVGFCSVIYLEYKIEHTRKRIRTIQAIIFPMLAIYDILCLISINTGWIFRIDSNGVYHRGEFFWISETICMLLIAFPTFRAIKVMLRTNDAAMRKMSMGIITIVIPPVAGAVIQLFIYGLSTNWIGVVISIFIIFIDYQNAAIFTDSLTGINNRRVFYKYLENKTALTSGNQKLFLYQIDVNNFKSINDSFGHAEGDNALIYITEILKCACSKNDDFLARIGGDEFTIVCIRDYGKDTNDMVDTINQKIERFNEIKCADYKLSLSIGCAEFGQSDTATIDDLIRKADKRMYEEKKRYKMSGAEE